MNVNDKPVIYADAAKKKSSTATLILTRKLAHQ